MNAKELIKAGRLSEARRQIVDEVKASPADAGKRTLLFQIHALCGEWDKAERDLDLIGARDAKTETGVQVYKNIVNAEKERLEVFKLVRRPSFLPEPPPFAELHYVFREKLMNKEMEKADGLYNQIKVQIQTPSGIINGRSFSGFNDTDLYTAFFLEAIVHQRYIWIPFTAIRELTVTPPKTLFDVIWASSRLTTWEGLTLNCFLPVLYAESFLHEDDRIKMGRMTDWTSIGGLFAKGAGQHVYQIGDEEIALLEIQDVSFNLPGEAKSDEK